MKKLFLWYSGTGTTAEHMRNFFNITASDTIKIAYVDGLGTENNRTESQTLSNNQTGSWTEWLMGFFRKTELLHDQAYGYKEKHQLAQLEHYFKLLEEIDPEKDNHVELIIGGHSRGAAAGVLGFITALYSCCKEGNTLEGSPIKKIRILGVDPVPGTKGNDLLGLESETAEFKKNPILNMLNFIESSSKKENLFSVIYYAARFDARNEFKADDYWLNFYKSQLLNKQIDTEFYIGGFRHSAMVFEDDEISSLYNGNARPTALMKELVKRELGLPCANIVTLYNGLTATELTALSNLASDTGNTTLINRTNKSSYGSASVAYTGSSLQEIVKKITANGTKKSELNKANLINNRYLTL